MLRTKVSIIPAEWELKNIPAGHVHDRENAALALQTARLFKVDDETAYKLLERWRPIRGRLELIKKVKNVEFYNDSASVNSRSTQTAVQSLCVGASSKNLVLVFGGASQMCEYGPLYALLPQYVHTLILLPGSGTLRERNALTRLSTIDVLSVPSVEEAARRALECAHKGDRVLFSPGFEAIGFDNSRRDRGERFVKAVRSL